MASLSPGLSLCLWGHSLQVGTSLKFPHSTPLLPPPRAVCEQLLSHLDPSNLLFWAEALRTVKEIVGGVDYKVWRESLSQSDLPPLLRRAAETS